MHQAVSGPRDIREPGGSGSRFSCGFSQPPPATAPQRGGWRGRPMRKLHKNRLPDPGRAPAGPVARPVPATPLRPQLGCLRRQGSGRAEVAGGLEWQSSPLEASGNQPGQVTHDLAVFKAGEKSKKSDLGGRGLGLGPQQGRGAPCPPPCEAAVRTAASQGS